MNKQALIVAVALLATTTSCTNVKTSQMDAVPVSIILDTDMCADYCEPPTLTVLHALADSGEVRILATVTSNKYELSGPCIDLINQYYGRPDLPIGAPLTGITFAGLHEGVEWQALVSHFPHRLKATADAPDAVQVYRRILAGEPDTSVVVVTEGYFTNLAALLQSPPDQYSPLDGKQLVVQKVKRLVSMAGQFPEGREWNVHRDTLSSAIVFEQWPTRITFSGWEIGAKILTGKRLIASDIQNTPVKDVLSICLPLDNPEGRDSWDQTAVLVAVRGVDKYFNTVKGQIKFETDGANSWQNDPDGKHEYLTFKMPIEELANVIEDLMMHEPVKKTK